MIVREALLLDNLSVYKIGGKDLFLNRNVFFKRGESEINLHIVSTTRSSLV